MARKVRIPAPLQKFTGGDDSVGVTANTLEEVFDELQAKFPGIKDRLLDDLGKVRRFVNVYVNEEDIRFLQGSHEFGCNRLRPIGDEDIRMSGGIPCGDGDEISIMAPIIGG